MRSQLPSSTSRFRFSISAVALTWACCMTLTGCGGANWHADTYPAHGKVNINGQPAAGAVVELHSTGETKPDSRNSRPWAVVQNDGTYVLSTYETGDGAPAGQYALTLRWPPDVSQPSFADRLSGSYARPNQSKWHITIVEGENELAPVEITSATVLSKEQASATSQLPAGPPMVGKTSR